MPFIIGSTTSGFIGNITYNYITSNKNNADNSDNVDNVYKIENQKYNLIDEQLNEREVNSDKNNIHLGTVLKDKILKLQKIIELECGKIIHINNTKRVRQKWLKLIDEYENSNHEDFVFNHANKNIKKRILNNN